MQFFTSSVSHCIINYDTTCGDNRYFGPTHSDPVYNKPEPVQPSQEPFNAGTKRRNSNEYDGTLSGQTCADSSKRLKQQFGGAGQGLDAKRVTFNGMTTYHCGENAAMGAQAAQFGMMSPEEQMHYQSQLQFQQQMQMQMQQHEMQQKALMVSHLHPSGDVEQYIINGYQMSYPAK
ncbi:hypothetical protein BABINDRAFT_164465 [Babjeviella inositovora NRRL Y-12698]|uniref:Uncharacterized protein n=1 Tax=Babjeviella inositovora NRRL Y-12698 TaxID=984486 RepID=A0A1E3R034_9ASCO|nr:uncharacterized protein BABINDRAFT_164465 [Babjeviella inositovora NRRL Y-12698]ODQ82717.1 hypothetical protein BABINDRAFT_164465 [Babjeviella inositovora NRRL Y-12698]